MNEVAKNLHEILNDKSSEQSILEIYKKLNERCDLVLQKIKERQQK